MWNDVRAIIHLDMDAYFASVEQKCNPSLKGKPVIVTGEGRRTVVATASYEARRYGIKTGMTLSEAMSLCRDVIRVVGNPEKYLYTTIKIHDILLNFTDQIETYSIDEFFLDITKSSSILEPPDEMIKRIKSEVEKQSGLSCSCGLAPNKLLAKLGSSMNKPSGFTVIYPHEVQDILRGLPVEELHGIGNRLKNHLNSLGIKSAVELGNAPLHLLLSHFGIIGNVLKNMGKGIDTSITNRYWEVDPLKSIGHSYTLPFDTSNDNLIRAYLIILCEKVAARLRRGGRVGKTVTVTIRLKDFRTFSHQKTVKYYIDQGRKIYEISLKILKEMGRFKESIRLIGVSVTQLVDKPRQLHLLEDIKREERLNRVVDEITDRFGEFVIKPATALFVENIGNLPDDAPLKKNLAHLRGQ